MDVGSRSDNMTAEEVTALIREIRERVRVSHPRGSAPGGIALPDLMPLLHSREAAESKVAAIGSVNPRPPGALNTIIQWVKRTIARMLDWHVREQVEFNRALMNTIEALVETLNEYNRTFVRLAEADALLREKLEPAIQEARELKDIRSHWAEWRREWERKLSINEVQFLRGVADLQSGFHHRATQTELNFRDMMKAQHEDFEGSLNRAADEIQKRLWADFAKVRTEYDRLIHAELRLVRQRAAMQLPQVPAAEPAKPVASPFSDHALLSARFRGTEEEVKEKQRYCVPLFSGMSDVLDIGCGRGEFLDLMREAGVPARGIDASEDQVSLCREKGLQAETADMFAYLAGLPEQTLDGIFCSQVIEHVPAERIPELVGLAASRLVTGGLLVFETPNPECLAIFATYFYVDPTHARPVPPALLSFYMQEYGLGGIEVRQLNPAVDSMPSLASLPAEFREAFFGGLDYAIYGRRL
ncbi:MAG: class I SAM-dependent methyltransferase [Bryobacteraceae bacterium]